MYHEHYKESIGLLLLPAVITGLVDIFYYLGYYFLYCTNLLLMLLIGVCTAASLYYLVRGVIKDIGVKQYRFAALNALKVFGLIAVNLILILFLHL